MVVFAVVLLLSFELVMTAALRCRPEPIERHVLIVASTGAQLTGGSFVHELDEAQMESRREPTLAP